MLEAAELPLLRVLGSEVAQVFADLHRGHGVDLRPGVQVAEITGSKGIANGVRLADGTRIEADAVIVGIGITPNTGLAQAAGLTVDNGIVTDQYDPGMEYTGNVDPGEYDEVVFRGDRTAGEFIAFWLGGGRVLAGMNVNVWDVTEPIQNLIRSRATIGTSRLADPQVPLQSLLPD